MPADYNQILRDNLHEYGHGKRHLAFLGRLYTDRTHFVYELLQNAEDAGASKVEFRLFDGHLLFMHDGRVFNEADVRGVCGVGDSTKQEDLTKIGKFGVGFKSVYALTAAPDVHSGDENFRIEEYIRPTAVPPIELESPWTTLFRFPFDHSEVSPADAFTDVSYRLENLGLRSLLFLNNLKEIQWQIADDASGWFSRDSVSQYGGRRVLVVGKHLGEIREESWLIYSRPVSPSDAISGIGQVAVEVAFQLDESPDHGDQIVRCEDTDLVVFFPTEKPTYLGFLLQGPYRTTPARDNIPRDDPWNHLLVRETAELVVDSIETLKDHRLWSSSALQTMPIQASQFLETGMFRPIFDHVLDAFKHRDLLPADDGSMVSAESALLVRGSGLRQILSSHQMTALFGIESATALSGDITQDRSPVLREYIINHLNVSEVTPELFARRVTKEFFEEQPDDWMTRFYGFLLAQEALWEGTGRREGPLRQKPFIRLTDNEHVCPFGPGNTPNAYLPTECDLAVPTVKVSIATDEYAAQLLDRLGLYEPDLVDQVISSILPKYADGLNSDEDLNKAQYVADLRAIAAAIKTDSATKRDRVIQLAKRTPFLIASGPNSSATKLQQPRFLYRYSDGLAEYLSFKPDTWFLTTDESITTIIEDVLDDLGVSKIPRRLRFEPDFDWQERRRLRDNDGSSREETLRDYEIDGLAEALDGIASHSDPAIARRISSFVWHVLIEHITDHGNDAFWTGRYDWFYYSPKFTEFDASFLRRLKQEKWLPDQSGALRSPAEMDISELDQESHPLHPSLIDHLGIRNKTVEEENTDTRRQLFAEALGVELSDLETVQENWDEFVTWRDNINSRNSFKPTFPSRTPNQPEHRQEKIVQSLTTAPSKTYEVRERSVRTTSSEADPRIWLLSQYTNDDGQMVCQICEDEMPFRGRSGDPYFETVESTTNSDLEHRALYLALCPVCAAKFKEFVKRDKDAQKALEKDILLSDDLSVALEFGHEHGTLRFVETHMLDLRTVLVTSAGDVSADAISAAEDSE